MITASGLKEEIKGRNNPTDMDLLSITHTHKHVLYMMGILISSVSGGFPLSECGSGSVMDAALLESHFM